MFKSLKEKVSYIKNEQLYPAFSQLSGKILEVGFGDGESFTHYPSDCQVFALEKDERSIQRQQNMSEKNKDIKIFKGIAEDIPFEDNFFDAVATSFVFCSVSSVEKALSEIERVLKPGGRFILLEHVRSENKALAIIQDILAIPYSWIFNNCHPNRNPVLSIKNNSSFTLFKEVEFPYTLSKLVFAQTYKRQR